MTESLVTQAAKPPPDAAPSTVAVASHPLHPMLVTFPIAFLMATVASDAAYLLLGDPFWARVSLWLVGAGTWMGFAAALAGTVELLAVKGIRRRAAGWSHFVAAVMLLSIAFTNWLLRLPNAEAAILPWGLYLSGLGALALTFASWLGGALVFKHHVGIETEED